MFQINWPTIRFEYEVLGRSFEDLVKSYEGVTLLLLQTKAKEENWVPSNIDDLVPAIKVNSVEPEEFCKAAKTFLRAAELVKQKAMFAEVSKTEMQLLGKIQESLAAIDPGHPDSALTLQRLATTLEKLIGQRVAISKEARDSEGANTGTLKIVWGSSSDDDKDERVIN
jgi:hypothetical protein